MSFIEESEENVKYLYLKEVSGGTVGGFTGRAGTRIDTLFSGPFHPDYNEVKATLDKQLDRRKQQRSDMERSAKKQGVKTVGNPSPVGGYFDVNTDLANASYDELDFYANNHKKYSIENTPEAKTEWVPVIWDYQYDEPVPESEFKQPTYDEEPDYYADENFVNKSETDWKYINIGEDK